MINSTLSAFVKSGLPFSSQLDSFAKANDFQSIPIGRYTLSDEAYVSVLEYETGKDLEFEAHKNWIDIQLIVSGSERIFTAPIQVGTPITTYDAENDIVFYTCSEQIQTVDLYPHQLAILFPGDLHAPGNSISDSVPVRKMVFKIPVELWNKQETKLNQMSDMI